MGWSIGSAWLVFLLYVYQKTRFTYLATSMRIQPAIVWGLYTEWQHVQEKNMVQHEWIVFCFTRIDQLIGGIYLRFTQLFFDVGPG